MIIYLPQHTSSTCFRKHPESCLIKLCFNGVDLYSNWKGFSYFNNNKKILQIVEICKYCITALEELHEAVLGLFKILVTLRCFMVYANVCDLYHIALTRGVMSCILWVPCVLHDF